MTTQAEAPPEPPGRTRRVPMRLVVGLVAIVLTGTAVVTGRAVFPAVEVPGGLNVGIGRAPERPAVTVGLRACLAGGGTATVTGVRPIRPTNGFRVVDVGVRRGPGSGIISSDEPVADLAGYGGDQIVADCASGGDNVAIQLAADDYPARTKALEIEYRVHGLTRTTRAESDVTLYRDLTPDS